MVTSMAAWRLSLGASMQPYVRNEGEGSKLTLEALPTAHGIRTISHGASREYQSQCNNW